MAKIFLLIVTLFFITSTAHSAIVKYAIKWEGALDYGLIGHFEFDNATAGLVVDETELISFEITGLDFLPTLGTFNGTPENFNFDAATEQFLVGGVSNSSTGQEWNFLQPGIGFGSGDVKQGLSKDGALINDSTIPTAENTLTARLVAVSPVPLPATLPLYAAGLFVLGLLGWRRKKVKT